MPKLLYYIKFEIPNNYTSLTKKRWFLILLPEVAFQENVAYQADDKYRNVVRLVNGIRGDGFDKIL